MALTTLRRALFYGKSQLNGIINDALTFRGLVPSSSTKMLEKTRSLQNVDCIVSKPINQLLKEHGSSLKQTYDLEDSVTASQKDNARTNLLGFLNAGRPAGAKEVSVRINSAQTRITERDLEAFANHPAVDSIVIPKVNSPGDIHFVREYTEDLPLQYLIESAKGLLSLHSLCNTFTPTSLIFAAEDFALDLSITRTPSLSEMLFARQSLVTHARAWGVPSAIDLVCTDFKKPEVLQRECEDGARMGFTGKQVIHPSQIEIVQRVFSPSQERLQWAVRVLVADETARQQGKGSWGLDGKMIDEPVVGAARNIVEKGKVAGMDVDGLFKKFKDTKPE